LFQRHFEAIERFFANKVDRDIEELVQETFARCVSASERFEGRASFRTFLFGVAHRVLLESFRRKHHHQPLDLETQSAVDLGAGPSSILAERQEKRVLLEGLRRIPVDLQVVLELHYWEGLTGAELSEILGIPEATAYSRIRRAKQLLDKALRRVAASPAVLRNTASNLDRWAASIRADLELGQRVN
ncbi:MAG: sigma-70 family RNA polymerase sigma factor, partial [Myxococcales bacterium]|nr:sigma-70 family RNA polymerase sigma factor [Myxococcales bacterium]